MVAYSDISQVNTLYEEQARIASGIALLDAGGTVSNFTVSPPPYDPSAPVMSPRGDLPMSEPRPMPMMMSVSIATIAPPEALIAAARSAMVARHNEITAELVALGVTASPPVL